MGTDLNSSTRERPEPVVSLTMRMVWAVSSTPRRTPLVLEPGDLDAFREMEENHRFFDGSGCGAGVSPPSAFFPEPRISSKSFSVEDALGVVSNAECSTVRWLLLKDMDGDLMGNVKGNRPIAV